MLRYFPLLLIVGILTQISCKKNDSKVQNIQKTVLVGLGRVPNNSRYAVFKYDFEQDKTIQISEPLITSTGAWAIDRQKGIYYIVNYVGNNPPQLIGVNLSDGMVIVKDNLSKPFNCQCVIDGKLYGSVTDSASNTEIVTYDFQKKNFSKILSISGSYSIIFDELNNRVLAKYYPNCQENYYIFDLKTGQMLDSIDNLSNISIMEASGEDNKYYGLDNFSSKNSDFISYSFDNNTITKICDYGTNNIFDGGSTVDLNNHAYYYYMFGSSKTINLVKINTNNGTKMTYPNIEMLGFIKVFSYVEPSGSK